MVWVGVPLICQKVDMLIVICSTTRFGSSGSKQCVGLALIMWSFLIWVMVVARKKLKKNEGIIKDSSVSFYSLAVKLVSVTEMSWQTAYVQLHEQAFEFFYERHCIFSLLLINVCTNIFMVFCCHKNFRLVWFEQPQPAISLISPATCKLIIPANFILLKLVTLSIIHNVLLTQVGGNLNQVIIEDKWLSGFKKMVWGKVQVEPSIISMEMWFLDFTLPPVNFLPFSVQRIVLVQQDLKDVIIIIYKAGASFFFLCLFYAAIWGCILGYASKTSMQQVANPAPNIDHDL